VKHLTPRKIVEELNYHIVGQDKAKRAVAIALRNRWCRQQVDEDLRRDINPKNIIMIGPTGVGKTEIARRLAGLVQAPFIKIEASRYTEVGYVGRDVESMIRDLTESAVNQVREEQMEGVMKKAQENALKQIAEALLPYEKPQGDNPREDLEQRLQTDELDDREVEIRIEERNSGQMNIFSNLGVEQMGMEMQDMLERMMPAKSAQRKMRVDEAKRLLKQQEAEHLVDKETVTRQAIDRVENSGIVFIDEIDKVVVSSASSLGGGPDVSREGVQRDMLPVVEGTTVLTRYGQVCTDHILFIAAGAFHTVKPSDMIPEFQGRFPVRVELESLTHNDFVRILTEPKTSLTRQYQALLETEGVHVKYQPDAVEEIARIAERVNQESQNIGARRLHTVMERLMEELAFEAPSISGQTISITQVYVQERLHDIAENENLSQYIL